MYVCEKGKVEKGIYGMEYSACNATVPDLIYYVIG